MNETTLLIAFIAVTSVAVVIQMLILGGMYAAMRKMMARTEALQQRLNEKALPLMDQALPIMEKVRSLVDESTPKLQSVVDNVAETSNLLRAQADKIDHALTDFVGKARNQADRAEVLANRTMERVDQTAGAVQNAVISPLRHVAGIVDGIVAGVGQFAGSRKARPQSKTVSSDDMFI